jgi:hypothetical protein
MTLKEIKLEVDERAKALRVAEIGLPTYRYSEGWTARPHIEIDKGGFHYVIMERGNELKRITTGDADDLLCHVFFDVSLVLASEYELSHRLEGQDGRRVLFEKQVQILAGLSKRWADRQKHEIEKLIDGHPYADPLGEREQGQLLSRIGRLFGVFAAPPGTSVGARSLPAACAAETETIWEVMKPLEMQSGLAAPWRGAPGYGVQYLLPRPIETLMRTGFIRCVHSGPVDNRTRLAKFLAGILGG